MDIGCRCLQICFRGIFAKKYFSGNFCRKKIWQAKVIRGRYLNSADHSTCILNFFSHFSYPQVLQDFTPGESPKNQLRESPSQNLLFRKTAHGVMASNALQKRQRSAGIPVPRYFQEMIENFQGILTKIQF